MLRVRQMGRPPLPTTVLLYLLLQLQVDAMGQDNFFRLVSCFSAEIRRQNDVVGNLEKRLL